MAAKFATVGEYADSLPAEAEATFQHVRRTIHAAVPTAGEKISYQMPVITLDGLLLVHVAAWKHHVGLYPIPVADDALERELAPYRSTKDMLRLFYATPMPDELLTRVIELLVRRRAAKDSSGTA